MLLFRSKLLVEGGGVFNTEIGFNNWIGLGECRELEGVV